MRKERPRPIIGQEVICPDGLGRVIAYADIFPDVWIQVGTYVNDKECKWAPENVELIDPRNRMEEKKRVTLGCKVGRYEEDCIVDCQDCTAYDETGKGGRTDG